MSRESSIENLLVVGRTSTRRRTTSRRLHLTGLSLFGSITAQDKATFLSQLSMMLRARVPIVKALELLSTQSRNAKMRDVVKSLLSDVRKGTSFSGSLARHPEVFDQITVVTAEVGQESGRLPEVLSSLAQHMEKMNALRKKVTQAMAYPLLVLGVASVVVTFMLLYIVPTFATMFRTSGVELPEATRLVMGASSALSGCWQYIISAVVLAVAVSKYLLGSDVKGQLVDKYALKIPWLGKLMGKNYTARFCRTLGTLLQSQVPLVDALVVTRRIFRNGNLRAEIDRLIKFVKQGRSVAEPLSTSAIFSPMVAQMISVGEETSELDTMLLRISALYEQELSDMMETLTTVIEPIFIVFIGAIVGSILIAMYLPMFDMANAVGGG